MSDELNNNNIIEYRKNENLVNRKKNNTKHKSNFSGDFKKK